MRKLLIAVALGAAGLTAAACDPYYAGPVAGPGPYPEPGAYPPGGPPVGQEVAALGCPIPGAEPNCLSFRSVEGYTFDISSAEARPDPRSPYAVEVVGRVSPALGYCQAGQPLEGVQIRQTNLRCVEGAVQGYRPPAP